MPLKDLGELAGQLLDELNALYLRVLFGDNGDTLDPGLWRCRGVRASLCSAMRMKLTQSPTLLSDGTPVTHEGLSSLMSVVVSLPEAWSVVIPPRLQDVHASVYSMPRPLETPLRVS